MSRNIERRIGKLTSIYGARGCDTCRDWGRMRVEIVPANVAPIDPPRRPARCPDCRRSIPRITEVVRIIMPDDGEGAA